MLEVQSNKLYVLVLLACVTLAACGGPGDPAAQTPQDSKEPQPTEKQKAEPSEKDRDPEKLEMASQDADPPLGKPLDRPEFYHGVFASPETPNRQWFVTEARRPKYAEQAPEVPPGHLAIGAMFGDVAPWHMKTLSDTEFEQAWVSDSQPAPVTVEFELASDGNAVAMTFTNEQYASEGRLERQGDLPEEWQ